MYEFCWAVAMTFSSTCVPYLHKVSWVFFPSNVPNIWEQDTSVIQPFQSNRPPAYKRFTQNSEPFLFITSKLQAPNPSGLAAVA